MANEKRVIDYSEVRKLFDEEFKRIMQLIRDGETHLDNLAEGFHGADKVIWKLPTVDAVEVVRCKDCWLCNRWSSENSRYCRRTNRGVKADDFCSYGERKSDGICKEG